MKVIAATPRTEEEFKLIPLEVETKGEVLASNIVEFREMVRAALGRINRDPKTDEEFGQADSNIKALKVAEESISKAIEEMDQGDVAKLKASLKEAGEEVRRARLDLDKLVKAKKQEVRDKHIADAIERIEWDAPVSQRERTFGGELEAVIKGKRVLKSIIKDLKTTVAIINGRISKAKAILDEFEGVHGRELIMDRQSLETKTPDQVEAELRRRLDVKRAEDEKRKAQEEAAKARAEAEAAKAETVKQAQAPKMEGASVIAPSLDDSPFARKPKPQEASDADMDAASEWTVFESAVVMAFGPIKSAKANLKHPSNVERATKFASAVNAAWHAAKEGGAQ